ncbi:hypothetical protein Bca4012_005910 [Brassica carinata]
MIPMTPWCHNNHVVPHAAGDDQPETTRMRLFHTDNPAAQGADQATYPKIDVLQSTMHDITLKIDKVTSSAHKIKHFLYATLETSFTKKITDIKIHHMDKLRIPSFSGESDPSDHDCVQHSHGTSTLYQRREACRIMIFSINTNEQLRNFRSAV